MGNKFVAQIRLGRQTRRPAIQKQGNLSNLGVPTSFEETPTESTFLSPATNAPPNAMANLNRVFLFQQIKNYFKILTNVTVLL
jgi:hypothetical protein